MVTVEALLEYFLFWVKLVDDRVRITLLVMRKNRNMAKLRRLLQELTQMRPLIDVDVLSTVLVLESKQSEFSINSNRRQY